MQNLTEKWDRLFNLHDDGQIDSQTYDLIDSIIILIEGIEQAVDKHDMDMAYRVKDAVTAINKALGL